MRAGWNPEARDGIRWCVTVGVVQTGGVVEGVMRGGRGNVERRGGAGWKGWWCGMEGWSRVESCGAVSGSRRCGSHMRRKGARGAHLVLRVAVTV